MSEKFVSVDDPEQLSAVFGQLDEGTFSIIHGSSDRITAGRIATAAFFAPLIVTFPVRRLPPLITNLSK